MIKPWSNSSRSKTASLASIVTITAFVLTLCSFIGFIVIGYLAFDQIRSEDWSGGVKPIIEKMWCGKPGCMS